MHQRIETLPVKHLCLLLVAFLLSAVAPQEARAQCPPQSLEGKEFLVMFLSNHGDNQNGELSLVATCRRSTNLIVQNPRTGYSRTVRVDAGEAASIYIPQEEGNTPPDNQPHSTGLRVISGENISLYASNYQNYTFDITSVLPSGALDTDYMAQTYNGMASDICEVGVLATEDSTVLTIITSDGDTTPFAYTLMAGQAQQFSTPSTDDGFGFSGLRVKSNGKPFAMFQGNRCTYVPSTHGACDHLYEQCLPVARWGRQFVLVPTAGRTLSGERVRVTSLNDNCTVQYDGTTTTLQGGGTVEYNLPPGAAKTLTASDKVTVCIYLSGGSYGGEPGDPAMVLVPPMEQGVRSATFKAINTDITTHHYANIVVATRYVPYMRIDTLRIDTAFHSIGNG